MPDRTLRHARAGHGESDRWDAVSQEAINTRREQATRRHGGPDAGEVTEADEPPRITLKNGAVVDAQEAVGLWRDLRSFLADKPDAFRSLLALAQGRFDDANPRHLQEIADAAYLYKYSRIIDPDVRQLLLNSYEVTPEGPVIGQLRLKHEGDRPILQAAVRKAIPANRPMITLKNGAVVDARSAVAKVEQLNSLIRVAPNQVQTLLALAEDRMDDANPEHFRSLGAARLLEEDGGIIHPDVREVLLNSYEETPEGPVVAQLRLQDETDRPIVVAALAESDREEVAMAQEAATAKRPTITLKNGAEVNARAAVAIVQQLQVNLALHPDQFQTLLALAEGRAAQADPQHFQALWADDFLEKDERTIRPEVRDVLLNCYENTPEGAVVVPLRLQSEADLPAAKHAQEQLDRQLRNLLPGDEGKDPWSRG
jgi:hypothetical protein